MWKERYKLISYLLGRRNRAGRIHESVAKRAQLITTTLSRTIFKSECTFSSTKWSSLTWCLSQQKSLPYLRYSLMQREMTIEGVRPPAQGTVSLPPPTQQIPQIQVRQDLPKYHNSKLVMFNTCFHHSRSLRVQDSALFHKRAYACWRTPTWQQCCNKAPCWRRPARFPLSNEFNSRPSSSRRHRQHRRLHSRRRHSVSRSLPFPNREVRRPRKRRKRRTSRRCVRMTTSTTSLPWAAWTCKKKVSEF